MASLRIDRLRLAIPGLTEAQGRDIAQRVATGLARATFLPDAADIPAIRLDLPAAQTGDPSDLAERIVAATLRALRHAAAGGA